MIIRIAFAFLAALPVFLGPLFTSPAAAQAERQTERAQFFRERILADQSGCEGLNLPRLNYINGVNTTDFSAYREALLVRDAVEMAVSDRVGGCALEGNFHPQHSTSFFDQFRSTESPTPDTNPRDGAFRAEVSTDEFYFNATGGLAFDAIETAVMIEDLILDYNEAAEHLVSYNYGQALPDDVADVFARSYTGVLGGGARAARAVIEGLDGHDASMAEPQDLLKISGYLSNILDKDESSRLLIVGYSQGSVYGALLRNKLRPDYGDRVETISIGTPLSLQLLTPLEVGAEHQPYVTSRLDDLMNKLRGSERLGGVAPADPNADNSACSPTGRRPWHHYHGLETDYLDFVYLPPEQELLRKCRPLQLETRQLLHDHVCAAFAKFGVPGPCNKRLGGPSS